MLSNFDLNQEVDKHLGDDNNIFFWINFANEVFVCYYLTLVFKTLKTLCKVEENNNKLKKNFLGVFLIEQIICVQWKHMTRILQT